MIQKFQGNSARHRVIALNAALNILSRGLYFLLVYAAYALSVPYLEPERFGVFSTILGLGAILNILDLGIGNVLIGSIARCKAAGDDKALGSEILCGLAILGGVAVLALLVLGTATAVMPIEWLFKNLPDTLHAEARQSLFVFVIGYAAILPLQGMQRIFQGLQKAYLVHAASMLTTGLAFALLYWAVQQHAGTTVLLLVTFTLPALAPLLLAQVIFRTGRLGQIDRALLRAALPRFFSQGGIFLLLQLSGLAASGIDTILVASQLGAASAGIYAITQRLFQLISYPLAIVNAPLWPAYADAQMRNDGDFIRKTLRTSFGLTILAAASAALILYANADLVLTVWLHKQIVIPGSLLIAYACWAVIEAAGNSYAMFLNGTNYLQMQLVVCVVFLVLALPLKFYLLHRLGLYGLPVATLAAYFVSVILPYALYLKPHHLKM